ncbi:hypothetical protein RO3G_00879 [Rhizopus delemar RA 99-880]|uniref:Tc1-like transposase DDE domain-containing protein n=1 Tax=Rhizopus delemar (strain RA 99-880 / ATCC MYA-4621 / FGSC 9543 / NRRL 43880) TaxID=246409 RepID=I1BIZ5_RHIO9|nr:hypothetical protein RO3G_00877 [Rhizopus delemar RA 99-880]EIE76175.1 hypothetical protein RO3G_00879 [Rhizopus delemar RA 99-880]|eukprot:EIE76173.1 hypothetical protein RO3G_00877 [Rhizopus delemar RA 99-880]
MYSIKGKIIFEDGQGNVFDESGNEAMDWDEEVDPHNLENLTNLTRYLNKQIKLLNAAESARRAGVKVRTGQAWSARMKEDPNWNIYEKQTNQNKIGTVTRHPHARNTDNTRKERHDWVKTWSKTDMDFNSNCVLIDESAFDINMRPPTARSARGTPVIITTPTTRAISHTILGAICPMGVVNMEIRVPLKSKRIKVAGSRKRKSPAAKKPATGGTNSGHYDRFMNLTLDEMDKYPEMKGFYLVMDNSPIHDKKSGEIDKMIEDRGYKCVYLPKYSPELNPIEQFWASVKHKYMK